MVEKHTVYITVSKQVKVACEKNTGTHHAALVYLAFLLAYFISCKFSFDNYI